jgi:hypothetical protein
MRWAGVMEHLHADARQGDGDRERDADGLALEQPGDRPDTSATEIAGATVV